MGIEHIHRSLILRIAVAGIVISGLIGVGVWFTERSRLGNEIIEFADLRAENYNQRVKHLLDATGPIDGKKIQASLDLLPGDRGGEKYGRFVLISVFDSHRNTLGARMETAFPDIERLLEAMRDFRAHSAGPGDKTFQVQNVSGAPLIFIKIPLLDSQGRESAYVRGAFQVSDTALARINRRVRRMIWTVVTIVLITTLMLYPLINRLLARVTRLSKNLLDANLETLKVLGSAIAKRDSDTDLHNYRVTIIAVRLAEAIGLPAAEIQRLIKGAFLHDVGKIGIRDHILLKQDQLTEAEFETMKTHVRHGLDIVRRSEWLNDAGDVVGYHHEKYNGQGYLKGLKGEKIPMLARIFAVADVFDALTSKRPYKASLSYEETMKILEQGNGVHFDPDILASFREIAFGLYMDLLGKQGETLVRLLTSIIGRYFPKNIEKSHEQ